ncbi:MAG: hypothetical protein E7675_05470 [Ruminococcaceae bacterium]|nr:hypothetical protein [Oscillospiraceae bacterium]
MKREEDFIKRISIDILSFLPIAVLLAVSGSENILLPIMAAAVHEGGHLMAAAILGIDVCSVRLSFGGAVIKADGLEASEWKKAAVLLSGSLANITVGILVMLLSFASGFAFANLILGVFNLLPVKSLDGGSVAELLLDKFFMPDRVYRITAAISFGILFVMWVAAVFIMIFSRGNITLYCVCLGLFAANYRQG